MLERGSYIPWASRFRRYINRKRENQKWLNKALDEGPYQFQMFFPTGSTLPTLQTAEDLQVNKKFLNSLQPEWLKYVTQVRLAKRLTVDSFDDLFDYLQQFEKLVSITDKTEMSRRTLRTLSSGNNSTVQCYNCSGKGHYARNCPKPRVRDSKYFMEQMLLAKQDEAGVILTDEQNDFLFADASRMEEIEELSAKQML
ncbi:integrase, catalytic region, zinc finger, CCHC-type containing protein [Tanacetum coccineum]|uniref:Integrase, catalytic region, zinc finger, CCHC-type containing protein n=1 Tax=Tanacetum coccineum TaxID=301880 RepID=A0ABQ4XXV9_9ASTR